MKIRRPRYFVLDHADNHLVEVDMMSWARWFEHANRVVDWTQVTSEVTVSTVFLGMDHRHFGEGPPLVFETMVFAPEPLQPDGGGFWGNWMWRYSSWDDAATGHKATVRKMRARLRQKVRP